MAVSVNDIKNRLTRLLSSIKLAVVLLILMAAVSVFGTVIPQEQEVSLYMARYGERGFRYLKAFGLIDLYHSFGFRLLTTLLTLNIAVCTYQRLKGVIRRTFSPMVERSPDSILSLNIHNTLPDPDKLKVLERVLVDKKYRICKSGKFIYAAKGRIGLWGDMISHASIILIIIGALVGSLGSTSTVNVYEKWYVDEVYNWSEGRDVQLGYRLYVDRVSVLYYPATLKVAVRDRKTGEDLGTYSARVGREFVVTGTDFSILPDYMDYSAGDASFRVFRAGNLRGLYDTHYSDGGPLAPIAFDLMLFVKSYDSPAIKSLASTVRFDRGGELLKQGIIAVNQPIKFDGTKVFLTTISTDESGRSYVGFQLTNDPGVGVVWTGFGLLIIGLTISFTVFFRQIWIYADEDSIIVGGRSGRDEHGFMREYGGIIKSYIQEVGE